MMVFSGIVMGVVSSMGWDGGGSVYTLLSTLSILGGLGDIMLVQY